MTSSFKKKMTYPLIGLLLLIVIIISGFVYFNKFLSKPVKIDDIKIDTKAALKLNALKQISKKNDIKEWELTADSATVFKNENKAVLIDVSIIFFSKDNKKIHLTSEKGFLNTKTHDLMFVNNVIVTYETLIMTTDKLQYNKKKHIIYSENHVKLEKQGSVIEADSMTTYLNDNTIILKGHVKGDFNEGFDTL